MCLRRTAVSEQGLRRPGVRTKNVGRAQARVHGRAAARWRGTHWTADGLQQGRYTVRHQHRQDAIRSRLNEFTRRPAQPRNSHKKQNAFITSCISSSWGCGVKLNLKKSKFQYYTKRFTQTLVTLLELLRVQLFRCKQQHRRDF